MAATKAAKRFDPTVTGQGKCIVLAHVKISEHVADPYPDVVGRRAPRVRAKEEGRT